LTFRLHLYFLISDDNLGDDEEEVDAEVKGEVLEPESGLEVTESAEIDQAVYQCQNCPRKFHRKRGLERHKTVYVQISLQAYDNGEKVQIGKGNPLSKTIKSLNRG
jgi:hypothetical protein